MIGGWRRKVFSNNNNLIIIAKMIAMKLKHLFKQKVQPVIQNVRGFSVEVSAMNKELNKCKK